MRTLTALLALAASLALPAHAGEVRYYAVPSGSGPHDVAPAPDGTVWYTAQRSGELGRLDPRTGRTEHVPLGTGSAPHGVIVGSDGAAWVTDGGLNAIVRVDPASKAVKVFPLPAGTPSVNMNTATFDGDGMLWWTGQSGYYGRLDPKTGAARVWAAPGGRGPYGIATTPGGDVWYVSLAGSDLARIDRATGDADVIAPPTPGQGARRVWSDRQGRLWISEWTSGQVSRYDPASRSWKAWRPPGERSRMYAVYVDETDAVWLTEWESNAILRFDPRTGRFDAFPSDRPHARVRQLLGRKGEVWGAESGTDRLVVVTHD